MDFGFSAEQQKWYDAAVAFAKEQLVDPDAVARDQRGEFWREGYERCAKFGAAGLTVPSEYGGQGEDVATAVAAMEGLGYGCIDTGLLFSLNASLWTITMPILMFGDDAQKKRFLPPLVDGRHFGANGASEPEAGSDIFSMKTRAERKSDRWVLNGRKVWITGGPVADVFLCFATTDPSKGVLGITAFLINRDTPGFKRRPRDPQARHAYRADGRARVRELRAARWKACSAARAAALGSSTPRSNGSAARSSPASSARCDGSSTAASSTPGPASSSASRSASSSRSRTGSST